MVSTCTTTRAVTSVWLVGGTDDHFRTSKLPSRGEVLRVLFHHHIGDKRSLKDSIDKTSSMLLPIWEMARIPTKTPAHVIEHLRKLHAEWQGLKKNINRKTTTDLSNQKAFQESMEDLFDIAHRDAMSLITIEEDRLFLEAQREKGRRGTMVGVDRSLTLKEERIMKRKAAAAKYALKLSAASTPSVTAAVVAGDGELLSDTDNDSSTLLSEPEAGPSTPKKKMTTRRGTMNVITPEVAAALDRTNTSDRKAVHILSAMASTGQLKQDVEELIISRSAIRRARMKHRELLTSEIKASFDPAVPLIVHWDGKIMEDFTGPGRERVDRLPILVSGQNLVKLLSVPKLNDGTAVTMSNAVVDSMDEWGLRNRIKGLCFDIRQHRTRERRVEFAFCWRKRLAESY